MINDCSDMPRYSSKGKYMYKRNTIESIPFSDDDHMGQNMLIS